MGGPEHKGGHHEGHHDHHHHHDQGVDPRLKGTPLDFTHKHPVFDINLDKKGFEFSEMDEKRLDYIKKYAGRVEVPELEVPKNIPGLVPRTGPLPSNRRLWPRPTSSFERNGVFNIHTFNFNTRFIMPFMFCFLIYGWWGHSTYGLYKQRYEDNNELPGNQYDKLNSRFPPVSKIWLRPG